MGSNQIQKITLDRHVVHKIESIQKVQNVIWKIRH